MMARLLPAEKAAAAIFLLLFGISFFRLTLLNLSLVSAGIGLALLWLCILMLAIFNVGFAFRDPHPTLAQRLRSAVAIPLAVIAVLVLNSTLAIGPRVEASIYLALHEDDMRAAQANAGPSRPAALTIVEGMPDGGVAVIRSAVSPISLPASDQIPLTGEQINSCRRIRGGYLCWYD